MAVRGDVCCPSAGSFSGRLWGVWRGRRHGALPWVGGPDDFPRLVELVASFDPSRSSSVVRVLVGLRRKLGDLLGWDGPQAGLGSRVPTLRERLPADLLDGPCGPSSSVLPFTSLYLTEEEWAAEVANQTVHGVLHIGRIPVGEGRYRAQMAILVKPNGLLGTAYMAAIRPFRYLIVYPAILGEVERKWRAASDFSPGVVRPLR